MCGLAAAHALTILTELAEDPLHFENLWHDEAAAFDAAVEGIGDWIDVEDVPEHDLAIVRIAPDHSLEALDGWGDIDTSSCCEQCDGKNEDRHHRRGTGCSSATGTRRG